MNRFIKIGLTTPPIDLTGFSAEQDCSECLRQDSWGLVHSNLWHVKLGATQSVASANVNRGSEGLTSRLPWPRLIPLRSGKQGADHSALAYDTLVAALGGSSRCGLPLLHILDHLLFHLGRCGLGDVGGYVPAIALGIDQPSTAIAPEHVRDGRFWDFAPSFTAWATTLSTFSTIKYSVVGEAPTFFALRAPISGISGPSMRVVPRSVSSAWTGLPSGPFIIPRF